jgi:glycosyltransferase involved in cell wall biosynthesis
MKRKAGGIVIISNYWKKSAGGGIKTYVVNLYRALIALYPSVEVIARQGEDENQHMLRSGKLTFAFRTLNLLCRQRPAIVITNNSWFCLVPAVMYRLFARVEIIHIIHSWPEKKFQPAANIFFRMLLRRCNSLVYVSGALKYYFENQERLFVRNTVVIHAGLPEQLEYTVDDLQVCRERLQLTGNEIVILTQAMTGHPAKFAGLLLVLDVLKELVKRYRIKLVITKHGKYSESIIKYVHKLGLNESVVLTGDVENPYPLLALSDFYLHITQAEGGVSLSVLEAMGMCKPVIVSSRGGLTELIDNGTTGFVVEPEKSELSNKLCFLFDNPGIAKSIALNGKAKVQHSYDWSMVASKIIGSLPSKKVAHQTFQVDEITIT